MHVTKTYEARAYLAFRREYGEGGGEPRTETYVDKDGKEYVVLWWPEVKAVDWIVYRIMGNEKLKKLRRVEKGLCSRIQNHFCP